MQETYQENYALCVYGEMDAASIMRGISVQSIKTILMQMGVEFMDNLPMEIYITAFLDEFSNNADWILKMIPAPALDYLLDIWEQAQIDDGLFESPMIWVEEEDWELLQYLRLFGLLTFRKGNSATNEPNIIYIVREMRDLFYFHLRSKRSQALIEKYDMWESAVRGFMHYYGLIQLEDLHRQFSKAVKDKVEFEEFALFLKVRSTLWTFGAFLYDQRYDRQYYATAEAENPDLILMSAAAHSELDYKEITYENLIYVSEAGGIDNRWEGISKLGSILVDDLQMNYYRATVFVKTIISLVQNNYDYNELKDKLDLICSDYEINYRDVAEALQNMYNSIPVFEFKGYSRKEYYRIQRSISQKKKREGFKIIKGGIN